MDKDNPIQYHNLVVLTNEEAEALYNYLKHHYISYDDHPIVIKIMRTLREKFYGR